MKTLGDFVVDKMISTKITMKKYVTAVYLNFGANCFINPYNATKLNPLILIKGNVVFNACPS